ITRNLHISQLLLGANASASAMRVSFPRSLSSASHQRNTFVCRFFLLHVK
ncbi:hypothetical protein CSUI_008881, partial [Cystoisospora suis]